ncbi:LacI family DNA-binding transcriptional regulator [Oceanobacillus sojae]|uniref:LacI family DNA-binding transcriptional regulator n=1 Tax=Oceanobacillus sojae TaxID=582851 RepID=UPI0021A6033D|nr:LacI family DNA-binding transcriptional regulator [Oceanobacillus sojae]MCT1905123.1 LacI family DNA-binding transcriptional regulator [Oceanobacillus sojae]
MKKKIGVREVAKEANVSPSTVSRVLNNKGYISEVTRSQVYQAMEKLEYYPNELAIALYKNKSYTVGLIFPTITNPFHAELIQEMEFLLSAEGYKTLLCNSLNNPEKEKQYLEMLRKNQVDGIIVGTHNENITDYDIPNLPIIAIDRYLGGSTTAVSCDNYAGGRIATELLVDEGCQKILCIRGDSKIKLPANSRTRAYQDVMNQNNMDSIILEVPFTQTIEKKREIIQGFLKKRTEIDGIVAGDDLLASLAIIILKENQKEIPRDVKVIGFDGAVETLIYKPQLTTIQQPIQEIANVAVQKLLNKMQGEEEEDAIHLPVKLIRGDTV